MWYPVWAGQTEPLAANQPASQVRRQQRTLSEARSEDQAPRDTRIRYRLE